MLSVMEPEGWIASPRFRGGRNDDGVAESLGRKLKEVFLVLFLQKKNGFSLVGGGAMPLALHPTGLDEIQADI